MSYNQNRIRSQRQRDRSNRGYNDHTGAPEQFYQDDNDQFGEGGSYASRSPDYREHDYDRDYDERGYGRQDPFYGNQDDGRMQQDRSRYDSDDAMSGRAYSNERSGRRGYGSQVNAGPRRQSEEYSRYSGYRGDGYRENSRYNRDGGSYPRDDNDRGFFDKAGDEVSSWFGDDEAEHRRRRDHRGSGPANYTRSNERLLEDACERLMHDSHVDARNITVTAEDNEITLDGTVDTRREKRRAEDCVDDITGVKHVQNNLRVTSRDRDTDSHDNRGIGGVVDDKEVRKDNDATNKATARKKS